MIIDFGTKVKLKGEDGPTWRVVGYDSAWVQLSGPGPCRGTKSLSRRELDLEWEIV